MYNDYELPFLTTQQLAESVKEHVKESARREQELYGQKNTFLIDGFYVDKFKEFSYRNPIETYKKLKDWVKRGLAQEEASQ